MFTVLILRAGLWEAKKIINSVLVSFQDASSGASTVSVLIDPTTNNTKPVNISVGNRGGGQAMDITNPYLAQNIIVRAL